MHRLQNGLRQYIRFVWCITVNRTFILQSNIEVVLLLKDELDNLDPLFAFRVNDRRMNGKPTCVFKTAQCLMKVAHEMNCQGAFFLSNEYAYFDGKFNKS